LSFYREGGDEYFNLYSSFKTQRSFFGGARQMRHDAQFDEWVQDAKRGAFSRAMELNGFVPRKGGSKNDLAGACPACGGDNRFAISLTKRKFNCRNCGACGRDALSLALVGERVSFVDACEALSGRPRPSHLAQETFEQKQAREAAYREKQALWEQKEAERVRDAAAYKAKERERLFKLWSEALPASEGFVVDYLRARNVPCVDAFAHRLLLKSHGAMPYYHHDENGKHQLIYNGPAILGAIIGASGRFSGLHITWVDMGSDSKKAGIVCPRTGAVLPSKKMRGSKDNGYMPLLKHGEFTAGRLIAGEGIETTLSVFGAMIEQRRDVSDLMAWSFLDLNNLGGKAQNTVAHPTLKTAQGRPVRVPNATPDMSVEALKLPEAFKDVVFLGDGDSDALTTRNAHARAQKRHACAGRVVRSAFAPDGQDFNDLVRGAAVGHLTRSFDVGAQNG
jgi:hypothetical protein